MSKDKPREQKAAPKTKAAIHNKRKERKAARALKGLSKPQH